MKLKGKYIVEVEKDGNIYSRHLKDNFYARNGAAIYITRRSLIQNKLYGDFFTIPFEMNRFVSIDIDSNDDLIIASMFYKYLKEKNEKKINEDFLFKIYKKYSSELKIIY